MRAIPLACAGMLGAIAIVAPPAHAGGPPLAFFTHYMCRRAQPTRGHDAAVPRFAPIRDVEVIDRFSSNDAGDNHNIDIVKPDALCKPVHTFGAPGYFNTSLVSYGARKSRSRPRPPDFAPRSTEVETALGTVMLDLVAADGVLAEAYVDQSGAPSPYHPYGPVLRCYDVARPTAATHRQTQVFDGEAALLLDVAAPARLCVPASKDGEYPSAPEQTDALLCHRARLARTRPKQPAPAPATFTTHDWFGDRILRTGSIVELCLPVRYPSPEPPSQCPPPTPTVTATPTVAPTPDRASLESLSLSPPLIARLPGESKHFIATGHFPGGLTLDLSQEVTFSSSLPAVAAAPNQPGDRNRVDLLAKGTTIISAVDPLTGVASGDSAGNATLIATGPLQFITTAPSRTTVDVCASIHFTATGHYEDGVTRNITQDVVWSSDYPTVARATNPAGQRSRIDATAPGFTLIRARDPVTGILSQSDSDYRASELSVAGDLIAIFLEATPNDRTFTPVRAPATRRVVAIGVYEGYAQRNLTEQVVFHSSNESAVQTPNLAGDRGKLLAIDDGLAEITATDPVSGITTPPKYLLALNQLLSVWVPTYNYNYATQASLVDVGQFVSPTVFGNFVAGSAILDDVRYVSSDPTIAEVTPDGKAVHALKPGIVKISGVDARTGITSSGYGDLTLQVRGPLQRITLTPKATRRLPGQKEPYLVVAQYEGGFTEVITQRVQLSSSNPLVASTGAFTWNDGNAATAVAHGTATIAAFDPVTGRSTTTTGDDATFTTLKMLASITVTPHAATRFSGRSYFYAAIGHDTDGEEINLTQDVSWTTSDASIAAATNPDGARSRIDTIAKGEVTITATEPSSGVSSTQSGPDATLTVLGALQRLMLSSEIVTFQQGQEWQLTATGENQTGQSANITQEVDYTSSNPSVVMVSPIADHRSRIVTVAPGSATLSANDPVTGITSTASGGDIVITVTP